VTPSMTSEAKVNQLLAERRVHILFATDQITSARVRGDSGIFDVAWYPLSGWHCTCPGLGRCLHVEAIAAITSSRGGS
jgi:uncharacterized Zn finger protein